MKTGCFRQTGEEPSVTNVVAAMKEGSPSPLLRPYNASPQSAGGTGFSGTVYDHLPPIDSLMADHSKIASSEPSCRSR